MIIILPNLQGPTVSVGVALSWTNAHITGSVCRPIECLRDYYTIQLVAPNLVSWVYVIASREANTAGYVSVGST